MTTHDLVQRLRKIATQTDDGTATEAADRIEALEAVHTDPYTPCPKCGFSVKIVPPQPFVYREDDE